MTLTALITRWLRDRERDGCSASTLRVYRSRTNTLRRALGERECGELSRDDLLDWLDTETHWPTTAEPTANRQQPTANSRKAPDTIRLILTVLKMLEEFALDREAIAAPWLKPKDYKKPKGRRRERLPTSAETQQLLAIATPEFALVYNALRLTGARPGELATARIEQIRTEGRRRTLVLAEHKTSNKTGQDRKIPIGADVAPYFERAIGDRRDGPIFTRADGSGWSRAAITSNFRKLRRQLGLDESLKLYCARHEFITAVSRKHGIGRAKYLAGHSSINTTQRYDHPTDEELHAAQSGLYGEPDEPHEAEAATSHQQPATSNQPPTTPPPRDVVPLPAVQGSPSGRTVGDGEPDPVDDRADTQPPEPLTGTDAA